MFIMGIKSFQGARKQQQKESESIPFKVRDYMTTNLITFKPEQSVEEVIDGLIKNKISGGPVVNNMPMAQDNVENRMIKNVETIDGNMNVFDAANKFLESKRRRFPIVENGKLIGQISQKDILIAALKLKGQNWK